jgi:type IV pilus assembly protein PilV
MRFRTANGNVRAFTLAAGFTLIETLVTLAVLSIGLLGLAMLQVQGMKFTHESYLRTQATMLAYDIIDRMRANKTGADAGNYGSQATPITAAPSTAENCADTSGGCASTAALANYDLTRWYQLQGATLPPASTLSSISRIDATSTYTITIWWRENGADMRQIWTVVI